MNKLIKWLILVTKCPPMLNIYAFRIVTKLARVPLKLARVSLKLTMVNLRGIGAVLGIGVMTCVFLVTFDNHWMISVPNALTGNSAQLFKLHQGKY